jgi:hypothetical protein
VLSKTLTPEGIYDALRKGHAYLAIELVAEARGFQFAAETAEGIAGIMGDAIELKPGLRLTAWLPTAAKLILFKDGEEFAATTGQVWQIPITEDGVYRLEASRHGKPWIFSNPIYVRPSLDLPTG